MPTNAAKLNFLSNFAHCIKKYFLTGTLYCYNCCSMSLTLLELKSFIDKKKAVELSDAQVQLVHASYDFLKNFASNKVIYGINTGFGPMAQYKISEEHLSQLQYNLIRSHSNGTGKPLSEIQVRTVMICRLNSLSLGKSGISPGVVEKLTEFLNAEIYPEIFEHGGVGASGDLVQLAHLALGLIGEGYAYHKGVRYKSAEILAQKGISPLELKLRDGLAIINGTSCMTGVGVLNYFHGKNLLNLSVAASAMLNEIISSYDDSFSFELNNAKAHHGQQEVAKEMRNFLQGSKLIRKREEFLFADTEESRQSVFREKVQEYYSIRCVPQILGPVWDTLEDARKILEQEINSANDNPIVDLETQNVYHGGNFHGDYVSLEMDKLKIVLTKLTMLAERQLNYMMNAKMNEKFPPFLNKMTLGLNFGLQGMQFTATSTTAENQMLANPMYVHSITNNNDNQDIVSMGMNSAIIADRVIENAYQVMAIEFIAICQAVDVLELSGQLSGQSLGIYKAIRALVPTCLEDKPQFELIVDVTNHLKNQVNQL
jgi:histidine ammonia-lyase